MSRSHRDPPKKVDEHQWDGLTTAVTDAIDGVAHLIATYDKETFKIHHAKDGYEEDDFLTSYFQLDFFEHEILLDSMFPDATQVRSRTLAFDDRQLVTVYDEAVAVLTIVGGDERLQPVQDALLTFKREEQNA
jgi:hypothetical protein